MREKKAMQPLSNTQSDSETNPESAVALLVVFLLVVVFIAQSGLLSGSGHKGEISRPDPAEMQQGAQHPQYAGT